MIRTCPHCSEAHLCYPDTKVVVRYDPTRKGLVGDVVPRRKPPDPVVPREEPPDPSVA